MTNAPKAVFISYAREDTELAKRIAEALRAFGVEVWFDQNELRGGDAWDQKIRNQIKSCALFIPLISGRTEERAEGYFRREWKLAVDRTHDMVGGRSFIVPVVIDETSEAGAAVPEEFMRYQWTRLVDGEPTPEFVAQVKRLLEGPKKSAPPAATRPAVEMRAAPVASASTVVSVSTPRASPLLVILGTVAILAVAAAVYLGLRPAHIEPAAVTAKPIIEAKPAPAAPAAVAVNQKSIAVLPFENLSAEKDSAFFTDGIHEDILTNLALVRELHVVSRTSVMQYRGTTKPIRQIAQELGVAFVLEGSVQRAGNKVRVTGQLINAGTDEHVWAKSYDRDLTDIFSIQSELSQEIARALSAALSPQEKQLLDRRPTESLAAYDAYVKARELRNTGLPGEQLQAEPLLRAAVQLDPKFAMAWAELGAFHAYNFFNEVDQSPARLAQAKAAIDTAIRLAPDAPEVIEKLGDYYYYGYRDYTRATEQYQRLAILRPNDAAVFGSLALIYRREGRWPEAMANMRRAAALDPGSVRYARNLYSTAQALCLYDEAAIAQQHVIALSSDSLAEQAQLTYNAFVAHGSMRELNDWLAQLPPAKLTDPMIIAIRKVGAQASGDFAGYIALDRQQRYYDGFGTTPAVQDVAAAFILAASGDRAAAQARAREAIPKLKEALVQQTANASFWANLGGAHVLLGEREEGLRCAQKAKDLVPESRDALSGPAYSVNYGSCLAWLGDKEGALKELARLLRTPFGENIYTAKFGPTWFPLRGDPRFEALVNDPKNNAPLL